ncbi:hypothetical protein EX895_004442 [Sporisorium graminicola]|uniref:Uncharacterized protein n=1 Tax=Sporisorium graminicola TaxID=280036 RepID=A0A4U7KQV1_9BASI|nr:hypothetical protein EX895_004442 [Sporisorium graminicola]TKY86801.1 hypothetical protein EX895_004442 [Sporisorium graminicola]
MASPLRRSARSRNADASATTPEPSGISPSNSPTKVDRKRKRTDDATESPNGGDERLGEAVIDTGAKQTDSDATDSSTKPSGEGADGAVTASPSAKPKLPKSIQSLLGLSRSSPASTSTGTSPRATKDIELAMQKVDELVLSEEDARKLSTILAALDGTECNTAPPHPVAKGKLRSANGSAEVTPSLPDLLRPGTSLRELNAHLTSLRAAILAKAGISQHLRAGLSIAPSPEVSKDLARLSSLTLVLGLVGQLASSLRQADDSADALKGQLLASVVEQRATSLEAKNSRQKGKAADGMGDIDLTQIRPAHPSAVDPSANRYALHMRLPRGDYFTKAIALDQIKLRQLDPAQADLVQISAQSEEQMRALKRQGLVPTPTLGQRLGRSGPRHRIDPKRAASLQQSKLQPVTFLSYGNYSSFAPTYDSSASSVSHTTSSNLWRNSARAQRAVSLAWGERPFLAYDEEEHDLEIDAPAEPSDYLNGSVDAEGDDVSMDERPSDELASVLRSLLDGVNQEDVDQSLTKLKQDEVVTSHLRFNMMLLHRLQEFQWARLRRCYRPSVSGRSSAFEDETPSVEEEATAALLLESLSSLVALRPRAVDLASNAVDGVVPDPSKLRAFSASSGAIDPDLLGDVRDGFWGALDANVVKVTKTGSVLSETPLVLRDDVTIRLNESSGSRSKRSARRIGAGPGQTEDRGRGALERFAASRAYDHKQDRHDINTARADVVPGPSAEQRSSPASRSDPRPAAAMSPNARLHSGYATGADPAMMPQAQRSLPGPNSSYAFASPAGGLSYQGRPMPQNAQASLTHNNWAGQGQPARQA